MDKIRAVNPNIIVRGNVDKPYYLIEYYDLSDNEWHIGYGSYCLANVKEWLKTCFEVTNADVVPVKHGRWVDINPEYAGEICTVCGEHVLDFVTCEVYWYKTMPHYCPNCGAKMDGGDT